MTSRLSTPRRPKIRPSSLANEILVAWKALHAYLRASAVRGCTTRSGESRKEKRRETASIARMSDDADHRVRRRVEVRYPRALTEKLGAHRDGDVRPRVLEGGLQYGSDVLDRSGWNRAADHHGVECASPASRTSERLYEVLHDTVDVGEVGLAARGGRRADAQERHVSVLQRIERAGRWREVPGRNDAAQPGLPDPAQRPDCDRPRRPQPSIRPDRPPRRRDRWRRDRPR